MSPFTIEGKQVGGKVLVQKLSGGKIKMLGISLLFGLLMVAVPDYVYVGSDTDIRFSRESGFYEESFYLEITGGGKTRIGHSTIRWTGACRTRRHSSIPNRF